MAEVLGDCGAEGRRVLIVGQMVEKHFRTQGGDERTVMRLIASSVDFLDAPPGAKKEARKAS